MKPELQKKLFDKYPKIFRQKDLSKSESCMFWGLDVGDGWYSLIDTLCSCIQNEVDNKISSLTFRKEYLSLWVCIKDLLSDIRRYFSSPWILKYNLRQFKELWSLRGEIDPIKYQIEASQVKEKFGGLRFYVDRSNDTIDGMISLAEALSYTICDECGNPGSPNDGNTGAWISTLCDKCRKKKHTS